MTTIMGYPVSVLALIHPPLSRRDFQALVDGIKARGLLVPIVLWKGQVIDGRHRLLACQEAHVEPVFERIPDSADPVGYVVDLNNGRRQMNASQQAMAAFRLWEGSSGAWRSSGDPESANLHSYTLEDSAQLFHVSRRLVVHAGRVLGTDSAATRELKSATEQGIVAVSDGSRIVNESPEVQRQAVELVRAGNARTVSSAAKLLSQSRVDSCRDEMQSEPPKSVGENVKLYHSGVADLSRQIGAGQRGSVGSLPSRRGALGVALRAELTGWPCLERQGCPGRCCGR